MIAGIKGVIFEVSDESVVIDVQGVFYEALCSVTVLSELSQIKLQSRNIPVFLYTYLHVREDAMQIFGFLSHSEKSLFLSLLKVSGIGPKSALHILSGATVDQILNWIEEGDVKSLSKLPKLGKKTAEQLVLTLRGKLVIEPQGPGGLRSRSLPAHAQVVSALVNLGFRSQDAERVVSQLPENIDIQEGIRAGLRELSHI
jgi:Holliday junction DNA helicase RuvA